MMSSSKLILQRSLQVFNNLCYTIILKDEEKTLRTRVELRSHSDFCCIYFVYTTNSFKQL